MTFLYPLNPQLGKAQMEDMLKRSFAEFLASVSNPDNPRFF